MLLEVYQKDLDLDCVDSSSGANHEFSQQAEKIGKRYFPCIKQGISKNKAGKNHV